MLEEFKAHLVENEMTDWSDNNFGKEKVLVLGFCGDNNSAMPMLKLIKYDDEHNICCNEDFDDPDYNNIKYYLIDAKWVGLFRKNIKQF